MGHITEKEYDKWVSSRFKDMHKDGIYIAVDGANHKAYSYSTRPKYNTETLFWEGMLHRFEGTVEITADFPPELTLRERTFDND